MNTYHVDQLVRLSFAFTVSGTATDPSTISLKVKDPTGAETPYAIGNLTKDSTGNYHLDITVPTAGVWSWHVESTGADQASGDGQFYVTAALA